MREQEVEKAFDLCKGKFRWGLRDIAMHAMADLSLSLHRDPSLLQEPTPIHSSCVPRPPPAASGPLELSIHPGIVEGELPSLRLNDLALNSRQVL